MMSQKTVAAALLVGSSILAAWVLNDVAYPAILCILGLLGLSRRLLWTIPPSRRIITSLLMLVLAALFAVHYRLAVISRAGSFMPTAIDAWQTVARFFLASMVLVLFLGQRDTLPASFAFFQIALIVSAGQILLLDDRIALFRLLEFASVAGAALYVITYRSTDLPPQTQTRPWRSSGTLALVLALVLTLNSGWVLGSVLYRYQGTINALGAWFWGETGGPLSMVAQTGEVGFSASGRLSSLMAMLERTDQTPALKINCDRSPGYLRARAFETYRQSEWHDRSYQEILHPNPSGALGLTLPGGRQRFLLSKTGTDGLPSMTIQHRSDFGDALFTRLATIAVDVPTGALLRGDDDILRIQNPREGLTYKVLYSMGPDRSPPDTIQRRRMLALPSNLDTRVGDIARRVFDGCRTTADKIEAVVGHFRRRYTYTLGLSVPEDQDAVAYFLIEASTGYCEYFASGAALLLRMADVPTRYVTGFLATEKDPLEDVWIVRNSHAHAWVEAWDQDQGSWTVVEATVSQDAGLGQDPASGNAGDRDGWLLYQQFLRAAYAYGLFGPLAWAVTYHPVWAAVGSLIGAIGLVVLWVFIRKARTRASEGRGPTRTNPIYKAMARLLAHVDRRIRRWGLVRGPAETLQAFSLRLEQHALPDHRGLGEAQWYRRYSDLRYRPVVTAHDVQDLRQAARHL